MEPLTDAQANVLAFIVSFGRERQMPPTRAEISDNFGWSSANAANDHILALERKGYLRLTKKASRGIFVLRKSETS